MKTEAKENSIYDVIIVGGGPAGLSAALILGRSRRRVLLFDAGKQRNRFAEAMHAYLSRDGVNPMQFLQLCRTELDIYDVTFRQKEVVHARKREDGAFEVEDEEEKTFQGRKMLLATGVRDIIPELKGITELYGKSVHHCPYCDGWEHRDQPIAIYSRKKGGVELALNMTNWSRDLVLCTDASRNLNKTDQIRLEQQGIRVINYKIERLEGWDGRLKTIHFENGGSIDRKAMFFYTGYMAECSLAVQLNCALTKKHEAKVNHVQETNIEGLYVSGDVAHEMKLVIIAAGKGAKAGVAINKALTREDLELVTRDS